MDVQNIETNSQQLDELVTALIGDKAVELDNYMTTVRACLLNTNQVSNEDLHLISLRLGVFMYALIDHVEKLNVRKGVSKEQAVYSENDALLKSTGTVQEKKAKAQAKSEKKNEEVKEIEGKILLGLYNVEIPLPPQIPPQLSKEGII